MLKGYSLIYYAPGEWEGLWRNRHQLMSIFARENKVLFVERRLHLRSVLADLRRGQVAVADLYRPCLRHISHNLFVFRYPMWAAHSGHSPLREFTRTVRRISMQNALRRLQIAQPIVWYSKPSMMELFSETPDARLRLYHVVDEYSAYVGQTPHRRKRTERQEAEMIPSVDAVIVVSKVLYQAKRGQNPHTYLIPNGVNYQAYTAALADPYLPADLESIRPPRLGYLGLIGDKLDFGMLKELAEGNPEWSLVLLGKVRVEEQARTWEALRSLPNVHQLGPVDVSQVPFYGKGFDVGLMPYVQNRHAQHISPLKLYDYLAAGLPVASMDIPAAREFEAHVHLARHPCDFVQAVRAALVDVTPERRRARMQVAAQHTWESRVETLSTLIEDLLAAKAKGVQIPVHAT